MLALFGLIQTQFGQYQENALFIRSVLAEVPPINFQSMHSNQATRQSADPTRVVRSENQQLNLDTEATKQYEIEGKKASRQPIKLNSNKVTPNVDFFTTLLKGPDFGFQPQQGICNMQPRQIFQNYTSEEQEFEYFNSLQDTNSEVYKNFMKQRIQKETQTFQLQTEKFKYLNQLIKSAKHIQISDDQQIRWNITYTSYSQQLGDRPQQQEVWRVSHMYYKPKWDTLTTNQRSFIIQEHSQLSNDIDQLKHATQSSNNAINWRKIELQKRKVDLTSDCKKEYVKLETSSLKIIMPIKNDLLDWRDPRRNSYLNVAFDWQRNYQMDNKYQEKVDEMLLQQRLWAIYAKKHASKIYQALVDSLCEQCLHDPEYPDHISKISYTTTATHGLQFEKDNWYLLKDQPTKINLMEQSDLAFNLFGGNNPQIVINDGFILDTDWAIDQTGKKYQEIQLQPLKVHNEEFCIENRSVEPFFFDLGKITSSTLEMQIVNYQINFSSLTKEKYPDHKITDTYKEIQSQRLVSGMSICFKLKIVPEIGQLPFNHTIFIPIASHKKLYHLPVVGTVLAKNCLNLWPIFYTDIVLSEQINHSLQVDLTQDNGCYQKGSVQIKEIKNNDQKLKFFWPDGTAIDQSIDMDPITRHPIYWHFFELGSGKLNEILIVRYEATDYKEYRTQITIETSRYGSYEIPFYFQATRDLVKFKPLVADFGYVPFRFDSISIPIYIKTRRWNSEILVLEEVYLPFTDERLDFVMGSWSHDPRKIVKKSSRGTSRLRDSSRIAIYPTDLHVCTVILKPFKFGILEQMIHLKVTNQNTNQSYIIEYPIIGYVSPDISPLSSQNITITEDDLKIQKFDPFLTPKAERKLDTVYKKQEIIHYLNYKSFLRDDSNKNNKQDYWQRKIQMQHNPVSLLNTFTQDINMLANPWTINLTQTALSEKLSWQEPLIFENLPELDKIQKGEVRWKAQTEAMAMQKIILYTQNIRSSNGHEYYSFYANFTHFPFLIQESDQMLICSIQENYQPVRHCDCQHLTLNFGKFHEAFWKTRYVNITNPFSEEISLNGFCQTEREFPMKIHHIATVDSSLTRVPNEARTFLLNKELEYIEENKDFICTQPKIVIKPGQTAMLKLVLQKKFKQKFFRIKVNVEPKEYQSFMIEIYYKLTEGGYWVEKAGNFFGDVGIKENVNFTATLNSHFKQPWRILQVKSSDQRFKIQIQNPMIYPGQNNFTIQFDALFQQPPGYTFQMKAKKSVEILDSVSHFKEIQRIMPSTISSWLIKKNFNTELLESRTEQFHVSQDKKFLSLLDIAIWRDDMTKIRNHSNQSKQNSVLEKIFAKIQIKTDIVDEIAIYASLDLVDDQIKNGLKLLEFNTIDFGTAEIGSTLYKDFEITNPYDHDITLQLFIGTDFFDFQVNESENLIEIQQAKDAFCIKNVDEINKKCNKESQAKYNAKIKMKEKMPFMVTWCFNHEQNDIMFRKKQADMKGDKFIDYGITEYKQKKLLKKNLKLSYEQLFKDGILIDGEFDMNYPQKQCQLFEALFVKNSNKVDDHNHIWQQIEYFYKYLFFEDLKFEQEQKESLDFWKTKEFIWSPNSEFGKNQNNTFFGIDNLTMDNLHLLSWVDYLYFEDIMSASNRNHHMQSYLNLTDSLSFPNVIEHSELSWLMKVFKLQTYKQIIAQSFQIVKDALNLVTSVSVKETFQFIESYILMQNKNQTFVGDIENEIDEIFFTKKWWEIGLKLNKLGNLDQIQTKAKKGIRPPALLTGQYQLNDETLHEQLLKQEKTLTGEQRDPYTQHFFLNQKYLDEGVYVVPPYTKVSFKDLIVFQPTLVMKDLIQFKAKLYVKTGVNILQTIDLFGASVANVLEVNQVFKIGNEVMYLTPIINDAVFSDLSIEPQIYNITQRPCEYFTSSNKWQTVEYEGRQIILDSKMMVQKFTQCLDAQNSQIRTTEQLFEGSKIVKTIYLTITEQDLFGHKDRLGITSSIIMNNHLINPSIQQSLSYLKKLLLQGLRQRDFIRWNHELDTQNYKEHNHLVSDVRINQLNAYSGKNEIQGMIRHQTEWVIRLFNLRGGDFSVINVLLEDPITGQQSCEQDGLFIDNCNSKYIGANEMLDVRVIYTNQFTVTRVKKYILVKSSFWTQKFELDLVIDPNVLQLVNQVTDFTLMSGLTFNFIKPLLCVAIYAILVWMIVDFIFLMGSSFGFQRVSQSYTIDSNLQIFQKQIRFFKQQQKSIQDQKQISEFFSEIQNLVCLSHFVQSNKFTKQNSLFFKEFIGIIQKRSFLAELIRKQHLDFQLAAQKAMEANEADYDEKHYSTDLSADSVSPKGHLEVQQDNQIKLRYENSLIDASEAVEKKDLSSDELLAKHELESRKPILKEVQKSEFKVNLIMNSFHGSLSCDGQKILQSIQNPDSKSIEKPEIKEEAFETFAQVDIPQQTAELQQENKPDPNQEAKLSEQVQESKTVIKLSKKEKKQIEQRKASYQLLLTKSQEIENEKKKLADQLKEQQKQQEEKVKALQEEEIFQTLQNEEARSKLFAEVKAVRDQRTSISSEHLQMVVKTDTTVNEEEILATVLQTTQHESQIDKESKITHNKEVNSSNSLQYLSPIKTNLDSAGGSRISDHESNLKIETQSKETQQVYKVQAQDCEIEKAQSYLQELNGQSQLEQIQDSVITRQEQELTAETQNKLSVQIESVREIEILNWDSPQKAIPESETIDIEVSKELIQSLLQSQLEDLYQPEKQYSKDPQANNVEQEEAKDELKKDIPQEIQIAEAPKKKKKGKTRRTKPKPKTKVLPGQEASPAEPQEIQTIEKSPENTELTNNAKEIDFDMGLQVLIVNQQLATSPVDDLQKLSIVVDQNNEKKKNKRKKKNQNKQKTNEVKIQSQEAQIKQENYLIQTDKQIHETEQKPEKQAAMNDQANQIDLNEYLMQQKALSDIEEHALMIQAQLEDGFSDDKLSANSQVGQDLQEKFGLLTLGVKRRKRKRGRGGRGQSQSSQSQISSFLAENIDDLLGDADLIPVQEQLSQIQGNSAEINESEEKKISRQKKRRSASRKKRNFVDAFKSIKHIFGNSVNQLSQDESAEEPSFMINRITAPRITANPSNSIFGGSLGIFDNPDGGSGYESLQRLRQQNYNGTFNQNSNFLEQSESDSAFQLRLQNRQSFFTRKEVQHPQFMPYQVNWLLCKRQQPSPIQQQFGFDPQRQTNYSQHQQHKSGYFPNQFQGPSFQSSNNIYAHGSHSGAQISQVNKGLYGQPQKFYFGNNSAQSSDFDAGNRSLRLVQEPSNLDSLRKISQPYEEQTVLAQTQDIKHDASLMQHQFSSQVSEQVLRGQVASQQQLDAAAILQSQMQIQSQIAFLQQQLQQQQLLLAQAQPQVQLKPEIENEQVEEQKVPEFNFEWKQLKPSDQQTKQMQMLASKLERKGKADLDRKLKERESQSEAEH